jgi:hypothetical protein
LLPLDEIIGHQHGSWSEWLEYGHIYTERVGDNPNTTQTLEYTKDKYNAKIRKQRVSPKVPPTTYKGQRIK